MATFSTATVSALTTSGCTVTFNAAAIDLNAAQIRQLQKLFNNLAANNACNEGGNTSGTVTLAGVSI
jgi:hypothetical protein